MEVVEQFILGKKQDQNSCEDGIFVNDNFISIIDGATSHSGFEFNGKKTGKLICDIILEALACLAYNATIGEALLFINTYIINWYKENGLYENFYSEPLLQPSASVLIYSNYHRQLWLVGDSTALYGSETLENSVPIDEMYIKIRLLLIDYLLSTGETVESLLEKDIARNVVSHITKRQPLIKNKVFNSKYDYAVIDGFNTPPAHLIKYVNVPLDINEICLSSDGYFKIFNTLNETEKFLQHMKDVDPLRYKEFPFTKGFYKNQNGYDDRSYIRFKI